MPSPSSPNTDSTRRDTVATMAAATVAAATLAASVLPATAAPADIDPESGNRLPLPRRDDLDAEGQRIFDQVVDPKGATLRGLRGPSGLYLHSPKLAALTRPLNNYLRNGVSFSGRIREIAILAAARSQDNQFEWAAHEGVALKEGVPPETIDVIKHRQPSDGLVEPDATIIELCRASFERRRVSSELYARALALFGKQQLVDLVTLMGYYVMTAGVLTAFDMQLDPGQEPLLPVP